uniref:Uncharacterized protein n=1 Tax=Cucumis sativus TaxID=3659 RepID=A0A0A0KG18_CUCSA
MSSSTPNALKTYEGSKLALVHALPLETATSFNPISKLSPSTYANDKFRLPGYRFSMLPFTTTPSSFAFIPFKSRSCNAVIRLSSYSISFIASSQAAPIPTTNGVGTVPLLIPLSCPPPFIWGSTRILGLLRIYRAPIPFGP